MSQLLCFDWFRTALTSNKKAGIVDSHRKQDISQMIKGCEDLSYMVTVLQKMLLIFAKQRQSTVHGIGIMLLDRVWKTPALHARVFSGL
jgi:hypothetical protein